MFFIRHESTPPNAATTNAKGLGSSGMICLLRRMPGGGTAYGESHHPYHELKNAIERTSEVTKQ
jgi:hypothetical protein